MKHVLILSATSDVGRALAHRYAHAGYALTITSRDAPSIAAEKDDLVARYDIPVKTLVLDVLDLNTAIGSVKKLADQIDGVICCVGFMPDQKAAEQDPNLAQQILLSNFANLAIILDVIAASFEARQHGFIVGVSSVAGERGRQQNYLYGASKAGFTAYLSGLRQRLHSSNVSVLTVIPGYIDTKMVAHINLPKLITACPIKLAEAIYQAQQRRRSVIYYKRIWWWIMWVVRSIPEVIYKRLKI